MLHGITLGIVLVVVLVVVPVYFFNRLVVLRNRCTESWANVDTELKRRYDLIPNLVSAVKGYAAHERGLLDRIVALRTQAMANHGRPSSQQAYERPLVDALGTLFAVAEDYPDLKASGQFLNLQRELAISEDRIQAARRFYNANVRDYRDTLRAFPGNVFGSVFRFASVDFFEIDPVDVHLPRVRMEVGP